MTFEIALSIVCFWEKSQFNFKRSCSPTQSCTDSGICSGNLSTSLVLLFKTLCMKLFKDNLPAQPEKEETLVSYRVSLAPPTPHPPRFTSAFPPRPEGISFALVFHIRQGKRGIWRSPSFNTGLIWGDWDWILQCTKDKLSPNAVIMRNFLYLIAWISCYKGYWVQTSSGKNHLDMLTFKICYGIYFRGICV